MKNNLFKLQEYSKENEILKELFQNNSNIIEVIYSNKQESGPFISEMKEFVYIVKGKGSIIFQNETINLKKGDFYIIPENKFHDVKTSKKTIWLTFYFK